MADGIVLRCQTIVAAVGTSRISMAIWNAPEDMAAAMEEMGIMTETAIMIGTAITIAMETAVMGPGVHILRPAKTLP